MAKLEYFGFQIESARAGRDVSQFSQSVETSAHGSAGETGGFAYFRNGKAAPMIGESANHRQSAGQ
jgi:hypothetical protein